MNKEQAKFIIKNIPPFNKLRPAALARLMSLAQIHFYPAASLVYSEGSPPDFFYILLSGRLAITTSHGSIQQHIELIKRGTCFGVISFFTEDPHSVTAKALEPSIAACFPKQLFQLFLSRHPGLFMELSRLFSQRVKKRTHAKTIFKSKKIFITGLPLTGKTTYMLQLAAQLLKYTGKKVICVEVSADGKFTTAQILKTQGLVLRLDNFHDEQVHKYVNTVRIDHILVHAVGKAAIVPLLNVLAEDYHYILCEITALSLAASEMEITVIEGDVHFLVPSRRSALEEAGKIITELICRDRGISARLKMITCEFTDSQEITYQEKIKILGMPVYATLLAFEHLQYQNTLRRIARQVGEAVMGLALGGGGAFACAHAGVLDVLEENNITVDMAAGTSMGGLVAALWACGYDGKQTVEIVADFGRTISAFSVRNICWPFSFSGLMRGRRLEDFLKSIFQKRTFQDLKRPLYITAFDFRRRELKILNEGPLYKVIAASCAYPGLFEPIKFGNDFFLDGGVLAPLPTTSLLNCGANKIIAVDIAPSREEICAVNENKNRFHVFDFIFGSVEAMQKEFIRQALNVADVVVHPNLAGQNWLDFNKGKYYVELGRVAAENELANIKNLAKE